MKDSHTKLTFHVCQYNDTQRLATLRHTGKFFKKKKRDPKLMKTTILLSHKVHF